VERAPLLASLVALYVAAEVISNVTAGRLVALGPVVVPGAIFLYAMTFTLRDAIHAAGGLGVARAAVWGGFLANGLLALYGLFVLALPAPPWFDDAAYRSVLGQSARVVAASLTAYLTSQLVNTHLFETIRGGIAGKVALSNAVAIGVDTLVFITLAFAGTGAPLLNMMLGQILFKLLISYALIPLVVWVRGAVAGLPRRAPRASPVSGETSSRSNRRRPRRTPSTAG